jgi:hypothetical protein
MSLPTDAPGSEGEAAWSNPSLLGGPLARGDGGPRVCERWEAGRRDRPLNQSHEAHHPAWPLNSPEGGLRGWRLCTLDADYPAARRSSCGRSRISKARPTTRT